MSLPNDPSMPAGQPAAPVQAPAANPQNPQAPAGWGSPQAQLASAQAQQAQQHVSQSAPQALQAPTERAHAIMKAVEQAWLQRVEHATAGQAFGNFIKAFFLKELQELGPMLIQDVIHAIEGQLGGGVAGGIAQRPPGQP